MVISLTPDIEQVLNELAEKQGTTVELLALKVLRERFFTAKPQPAAQQSLKRYVPKTLAEFLAGYIGVLDSSEFAEERGRMSQSIHKKFADILREKRRQGRL